MEPRFLDNIIKTCEPGYIPPLDEIRQPFERLTTSEIHAITGMTPNVPENHVTYQDSMHAASLENISGAGMAPIVAKTNTILNNDTDTTATTSFVNKLMTEATVVEGCQGGSDTCCPTHMDEFTADNLEMHAPQCPADHPNIFSFINNHNLLTKNDDHGDLIIGLQVTMTNDETAENFEKFQQEIRKRERTSPNTHVPGIEIGVKLLHGHEQRQAERDIHPSNISTGSETFGYDGAEGEDVEWAERQETCQEILATAQKKINENFPNFRHSKSFRKKALFTDPWVEEYSRLSPLGPWIDGYSRPFKNMISGPPTPTQTQIYHVR